MSSNPWWSGDHSDSSKFFCIFLGIQCGTFSNKLKNSLEDVHPNREMHNVCPIGIGTFGGVRVAVAVISICLTKSVSSAPFSVFLATSSMSE